mgnify:CR=1 FL=1
MVANAVLVLLASHADHNSSAQQEAEGPEEAQVEVDPAAKNYWQRVAARVPGRSADECYEKLFEDHPTPPREARGAVARHYLGGDGEPGGRRRQKLTKAKARKKVRAARWQLKREAQALDEPGGGAAGGASGSEAECEALYLARAVGRSCTHAPVGALLALRVYEGCGRLWEAQQEGEELMRKVPEIDMVMGPQYANRLGDLLEGVFNGNQIVATAPLPYYQECQHNN